jgi:hypothetical protein
MTIATFQSAPTTTAAVVKIGAPPPTTQSGDIVQVVLDKNVKVTLDGVASTLAALHSGDHLQLSGNPVTLITAKRALL